MKIAIPRERRPHEARVAASPETVKKLVKLGAEVTVEKCAGLGAAVLDGDFEAAGATVAKTLKSAVDGADLVLKVQRPIVGGKSDETGAYKEGAIVVAVMDPLRADKDIAALAKKSLTLFAMDMVPRITRAQSMDVLSSQSNLAGYKAVLDGAAHFGKAFPMMMTAAGTIRPAKVMVMGAGVAGLQAIATARRLGAVVSATDVRPAAKEQVESLGASFVAVEDEEFRQAETAGGYAKQMSEAYQKKQAELIAETITKQDIVITTALIPGRSAPKLISEEMVHSMKAGSVIVDLAVEAGGNCAMAEAGKVITTDGGVTIVGHMNVPSRVAVDASALYARNLYTFVELLVDKESKALAIDWDDEIIKGTLICRDGSIVHPALEKPAADKPAAKKDVKAADEKSGEEAGARAAEQSEPKGPENEGSE
ncbi:MAG: Re/Si-specific NAD(P)(+) transhydrogenase subunit alpha [Pseudomonadota bacterium]